MLKMLLALTLFNWYLQNTFQSLNLQKIRSKAKEALAFCKQKNFSTNFCILIDMSVHSGLNRFIVWDFKKDTWTQACLVSHGCCENAWANDFSKDAPSFSNRDGSHCTSLGKYKLGARGYSSLGIKIKYFLHGLHPSNSNSFSRQIVLHSWEAVPDFEVYPKGTPEGWGCPAISNSNMTLLDSKLKSESKPVLLWIYQ